MVGSSLLVVLLLQSPASVAADTLTYREINEGEVEISAPEGPMTMETFHDAKIAFVRLTPDSAHAWYEALRIGVSNATGEVRPATEAALHQRFVLRFDGRGRVETLVAPEFPESFEGITDLTKQFYDFFMPAPGGPLAPGVSWSDTTALVDGTVNGGVMNARKHGRYEVVGDSVIGGEPVWIVAAEVHHEMRIEGPTPQPGVTAVSVLAGAETGEFAVHKDRGHMVARRRTGRLTGEIRYEGLPRPAVLPQSLSYTNSVELLPAASGRPGR